VPIIELPTLAYDDIDKDPHRLIDKLSDTLRQLDWLLNKGRLDAQNINQTVIQIKPEDPEKPQPVDNYGLNALYLDYYPNKCFNSSFEVFDSTTKKPAYWETNGVVFSDANFDNTYSLRLRSGQYAEQKPDEANLGLVNPAWWAWCNGKTRIALHAKGSGGKVRVSVWQGSGTVPLAYWTKDAKGNEVEVQTQPPHYLTFDAGVDWPNSEITFAALPSVNGGSIKLRIDNTGSADVYIDSVLIRADYTGKYPGLYKHGPLSVPVSKGGMLTTGFETYLVDYNSSGVSIDLEGRYTNVPAVFASINDTGGDPADFDGKAFVLVAKPVKEASDTYNKVYVYPKGSSVPTGITTAKIAVLVAGTSVKGLLTSKTWKKYSARNVADISYVPQRSDFRDYIATISDTNELVPNHIEGYKSYAFRTWVYVSAQKTLTFYLSHDDGAAVYLNQQFVCGQGLHRGEAPKTMGPITLNLLAGWNMVEILINNGEGSYITLIFQDGYKISDHVELMDADHV